LIFNNDITFFELSLVTNNKEHFKAASSRKEAQYGPLVSDLELADFSVSLITIEFGCLGNCSSELWDVTNLLFVC